MQDWVKNHKTIVCVKGTESEIEQALSLHVGSSFIDDDLGNMITAAAFLPLTRQEAQSVFGHFPLA